MEVNRSWSEVALTDDSGILADIGVKLVCNCEGGWCVSGRGTLNQARVLGGRCEGGSEDRAGEGQAGEGEELHIGRSGRN